MPNWCECELTVSVEDKRCKKNLAKFKRLAKTNDKVLDERAFVPCGDSDVKTAGEWCRQFCGDARCIVNPKLVVETGTHLYYDFIAAWGPPSAIVLVMSESFKGLQFELRYFEAGMGFNGLFICCEGKVVKSERADYFGHRGG